MNTAKVSEITFSDSDIVNPDDFVPNAEYNPHRVRPFLLHDHGFTLCVVFAANLQDALDVAADAGKLESFRAEKDTPQESTSFLGNDCSLYDIENVDCVELKNPPFSFVALWNAMEEEN